MISRIQKYLRDTYAGRYEPDGVAKLALFYWRMMLVIALCVIIAALIWGASELVTILQDLGSTSDTTLPPPPPLSGSQLHTVVQALSERQSQSQSPSNLPTISDPSK